MKVYELSEKVGHLVGSLGLSLVSGAGLVVGSASIGGFLEALRRGGGWDLERRLIARPFPQPLEGRAPDSNSWTALRKELARLAGFAIFIGGAKVSGGSLAPADGVLEEAKLAKATGAFLIPVGATGGAARQLSKRLSGSKLPSDGEAAARPSDDELAALDNANATVGELVTQVEKILRRVTRPYS